MIKTPLTVINCKWGRFYREKPIFKLLPVSWGNTMLILGSRSFQMCTVGLFFSKGCKISSLEIWKKKSAVRPKLNHMCAARVPVPDDWINLTVWRTVTLQPFDLQRLTVPLWKDLEPIVNIVSAQETSSILRIGYAYSNRPHLHRVY